MGVLFFSFGSCGHFFYLPGLEVVHPELGHLARKLFKARSVVDGEDFNHAVDRFRVGVVGGRHEHGRGFDEPHLKRQIEWELAAAGVLVQLSCAGVGVDDSRETKVDGGSGKLLGVLALRERVQVSVNIDDGDLTHKIWQNASMCCCTVLFDQK